MRSRDVHRISSRPAPIPGGLEQGRIVGQKRPLRPKYVRSIRVRLEMADNARDLALFNMAIDSKLRGCDLVRLKVRDVFAAGRGRERASITQSKTGRPVRFEITEATRQSRERWIANPEMPAADFLWPSRFHESPPVDAAVHPDPARLGDEHQTRPKLLWHTFDAPHEGRADHRKTGNLHAVQLLLGHTEMDSTVSYLGVELDDALTISEAIDL